MLGTFAKIRNIGLALLGLWSLGACSSREWTLIGEDDVRRLLPEYAILTASLQHRGEPDSLRHAAYRQFFEREGYTIVDWDSSMMWYAKHNMPLYHDYYRLASEDLSRQTEQLQTRVDSITHIQETRRKRLGYMLDSVNLLSLAPQYYFSGEFINRSFSVQPSNHYTGTEAELSVRIAGLPKLKKGEELELALRFVESDSTARDTSIKISQSGQYQVKLITMANKPVLRVAGYLRGTLPKLQAKQYVWLDSLRFVRRPHTDLPDPKASTSLASEGGSSDASRESSEELAIIEEL